MINKYTFLTSHPFKYSCLFSVTSWILTGNGHKVHYTAPCLLTKSPPLYIRMGLNKLCSLYSLDISNLLEVDIRPWWNPTWSFDPCWFTPWTITLSCKSSNLDNITSVWLQSSYVETSDITWVRVKPQWHWIVLRILKGIKMGKYKRDNYNM